MSSLWFTAFVDLAGADLDGGVAFWRAVTGYGLSAHRGEHDEFATLLPPDGDPYLRVQRLDAGPSRVHVDVHRAGQQLEIRESPAGFVYCAVGGPSTTRPRPATWPGGHRSQVDQVCLDIPPAAYDDECEFWRDLTDWELRDSPNHPEFRYLVRPTGQPLRLLLQRVDDDRPHVTAHLDLATDDRRAETERHQTLGARVLRRHEDFTVLADPAGAAYCITDRDPETGMLD